MPAALKPRDRLAVTGVRIVNQLSRRLGRGSGTVAGGRFGLRLRPGLLGVLAKGRAVALVTGTNGKTTTTAMIREGWGGDVASNTSGSNMPEGHVAALVASSSSRVVLEVDEKWLDAVVRACAPRVVVLLNLSRDQLDRSNEVRAIAERWRSLWRTAETANVVVVANANDPLVVYASETAVHVRWCNVETTWTADAVSCPKCTQSLRFDGSDWHCACGFAKPTPSTSLEGAQLHVGDVSWTMELSLPGDFNRANAAMAMTALDELGVDLTSASERVARLSEVAGRFSRRHWRGHDLRLTLAKNPAGFAAMLATVRDLPGDLWIAINARVADGRDPSWLYDVPFSELRGRVVHCFGDRRLDLATCLDYAGVDFVLCSEDSPPPPTGPVTVLANYTAFQDWRARSTT
ncbi:MAG TPA: MurT ligase domain-containing protein [Acidimicrobiales bacterium]